MFYTYHYQLLFTRSSGLFEWLTTDLLAIKLSRVKNVDYLYYFVDLHCILIYFLIRFATAERETNCKGYSQ